MAPSPAGEAAVSAPSPADEHCSFSTSENVTCRRVVEDDKAFRECVRRRETLRFCMGRPPEVMESSSETTREELPGGSWSSSSWSSSSSSSNSGSREGVPWDNGAKWGFPGETWGVEAGKPFERELSEQFFGPFSWIPGMGAPPRPWQYPAEEYPGGETYSWRFPAGPGVSLPEFLNGLVGSAETSARAALEQLGHDLEEFRPFRGLHRFFPVPASEQAEPKSGSSSNSAEVSVAKEGGLLKSGDFRRKWAKKNPYEEFAKDFEEL